MAPPTRGRYAPSPTGFLHLGNARTALVAWLRARSHSHSQRGAFVMRVEDLDGPRTVAEAVTGNLEELRWLGLDWDEGPDVGGPYAPYTQSQRDAVYEEALETLRQKDLIFECYLSRKDLRELASAPHGQGFVYGEQERTENERCRLEKVESGKRASLRFRVGGEQLHFHDLLAGEQTVDAARQVGDFVVRRADGLWAYQLAVVVDDIAMKINEVVRGDDLLTSTGAQLLLYRALGETPPQYLHVPLLLDEEGQRMAKRKGSLTLNALREAGVSPQRVTGLLAYTLGLVSEPEEVTPTDLLKDFSLDNLRREACGVQRDHLSWLTSST